VTAGLVLGTRGSELALWQARWVAARLGGEAAGVRIEVIRTQGDRDLESSLASSLEKGVFTREIELAMLDGRVDVAVHSLKDLPTTLPPGCALAPCPSRASCGDVLLVRPDALDADAAGLPLRSGARVGTASPRRLALLRHVRPDLTAPAVFRGNVPTRVRRCQQGEVDAVILARAGLERLGLAVAPLLAFDLALGRWLPAPAQGALGLEVRAGDGGTLERLAAMTCAATTEAVDVERGLLRELEAGCHAALGAWARREAGVMTLTAGMLGADGRWRETELAGGDLVRRAARALREGAAASPSGAWFTPPRPW
jgi:hydroxymethylbilane synthase